MCGNGNGTVLTVVARGIISSSREVAYLSTGSGPFAHPTEYIIRTCRADYISQMILGGEGGRAASFAESVLKWSVTKTLPTRPKTPEFSPYTDKIVSHEQVTSTTFFALSALCTLFPSPLLWSLLGSNEANRRVSEGGV